MGWSCSLEAGRTLEKLKQQCMADTGTQNCFIHNGEQLFFEISRREHPDGSVTGSVWRMDGTKVSSFKISGAGEILRGTGLKQLLMTARIAIEEGRSFVRPSRLGGTLRR